MSDETESFRRARGVGTHDETESFRRARVQELNSEVLGDKQSDRSRLEYLHGKGNVWDTDELSEKFEVIGFMAPYVVVRDKVTGDKGSCEFIHSPRFYFNFRKAYDVRSMSKEIARKGG